MPASSRAEKSENTVSLPGVSLFFHASSRFRVRAFPAVRSFWPKLLKSARSHGDPPLHFLVDIFFMDTFMRSSPWPQPLGMTPSDFVTGERRLITTHS